MSGRSASSTAAFEMHTTPRSTTRVSNTTLSSRSWLPPLLLLPLPLPPLPWLSPLLLVVGPLLLLVLLAVAAAAAGPSRHMRTVSVSPGNTCFAKRT